jgi:hypothetical protein
VRPGHRRRARRERRSGIQTGFLDLAGSNAAHFAPENIRLNWTPKHQLALDLARQAWGVRHPGQTAAPIRGDGAASFLHRPRRLGPGAGAVTVARPGDHRLYKMVKANILPMGGMLAAKAARAAGQAATDATRTVTEAPQRAQTWVEQLEQEIYRQYGVPR